jgi:ELWxxDGT repeat protein
MKGKITLLFIIILISFKVKSQELIIDLRPGSEGSSTNNFCNNNGLLFFTADDVEDGNVYGECELWKTDGTTEGTVMIKDINPNAGAIPANRQVVAMNGNVYFTADDGITGNELWKSDGTEEGTLLVKDIEVGSLGYGVWNLCVMNNTIYFTANDGVHGEELWKSDGTEAGTVMVKDILPGEYGSMSTTYLEFVVLDNYLYFSSRDATNITSQLWKTDGTEEGTTKVSDIRIERDKTLKEFKGKIYFSGCADCDLTGEELCVSDGTQEGTFVLKDINTNYNGKSRSVPIMLTEYDGNLFFIANDYIYGSELWKTDGTEAGTKILKDISPGDSNSYVKNLVIFNNRMYFSAYDSNGTRLWTSDGTEEGTTIVTNKVTIEGSMGIFKNKLYFGANDNVVGTELWESDGTDEGTKLLKDIQPKGITIAASSKPTGFYNHDDKILYFVADNGRTGHELWKHTNENLSTKAFTNSKINIYPNPSSSIINIPSINNQIIDKITITDLSGKKLKEQKGNISTINIDNLQNGTYILEAFSGNSKSVIKFIKK